MFKLAILVAVFAAAYAANVAKNQASWSSSTSNWNSKKPAKANDGNFGSCWESNNGNREWLAVSLGGKKNFKSIKVAFAGHKKPKDFKLQAGDDGNNWWDLKTVRNFNGGDYVWNGNKWAGNIRVQMTKGNGMSICEILVDDNKSGGGNNNNNNNGGNNNNNGGNNNNNNNGGNNNNNGGNNGAPIKPPKNTPVELHGSLSVKGTQLTGKKGAVQLKGMSSHGLQWFPQFVNKDSMQCLRDDWGASLFRGAMYTSHGGYIGNENKIMGKVQQMVRDCVQLGIYCMLDWHILDDWNPLQHKNQAIDFFKKMGAWMKKEFKGIPDNIIYEICNEPNGAATWDNHIKPYAEALIKTIRSFDNDGVIIVGTDTWSQGIDKPAKNPLPSNLRKNVMYTVHFYADSHKQWLRDRTDAALKAGTPVFVTEWGTPHASGAGGPNHGETDKWLAFLEKKKISWANWSLCDKNEGSAALNPGAKSNPKTSSGCWPNSQISESGQIVKKWMKK